MGRMLLVGGVFNDEGGRPSGYISKLASELCLLNKDVEVINGGFYTDLEKYLNNYKDLNTLFWFCDVPNDKPKLVNGIVELCPKLHLVISKNNKSRKYNIDNFVERMENAHSQILIEFKNNGSNIVATIFDNLGTVILNEESDLKNLAKHILGALNGIPAK